MKYAEVSVTGDKPTAKSVLSSLRSRMKKEEYSNIKIRNLGGKLYLEKVS